MADVIQIRRDTAALWNATNPILASGEFGYESDTDKLKIGDGTTTWTSLSYLIDTHTGYAVTSGNLSQFAATTSAQLRGVLSDETGTGGAVFATSPTLVTPALGTPASGVLTNATGTAASLTAGNVTTNANLTGVVTSTGNATAIANKAIAIAKLADGTDGELITWDSSGVIAAVAAGSNDQVLTSNGAGAAPTFQAAGGGGTPTDITVANEATDTTCFPTFFTAATGDLGPKSNAELLFDSSTGTLRAKFLDVRGSGGSNNNQSFGQEALRDNTSGYQNVAIGQQALRENEGGDENIAIGSGCMLANLEGNGNVAIGRAALPVNTTGSTNVAIGRWALEGNTEGNYNTALGFWSGKAITTGDSNTTIGYKAGTEAGVINITTQDNRFVLGNNSVTNLYCKVSLTTGSDERDKTDIVTSTLGLNFIDDLRPVTFRFDERTEYWEEIEDADGNITYDKSKPRDGSKASPIKRLGFIAQEVIATEHEHGIDNCVICDEEQPDSLKIKEAALIPVLVKALQELNAKFDAYVLDHP